MVNYKVWFNIKSNRVRQKAATSPPRTVKAFTVYVRFFLPRVRNMLIVLSTCTVKALCAGSACVTFCILDFRAHKSLLKNFIITPRARTYGGGTIWDTWKVYCEKLLFFNNFLFSEYLQSTHFFFFFCTKSKVFYLIQYNIEFEWRELGSEQEDAAKPGSAWR